MKRWTNGLPGATKRLGAKMALRGLAASQPRMRADTHDGPEQIAPLQRPDTLMQLSRSLILEVHLVPHGRTIHLALSGHPDGSAAYVRFWRAGSTGHCNTARSLSAGVSNPKVFRGRWLSRRAILFRLAWEKCERSVPRGKYCRSRPLVFSLLPRCQGLRGSQK